MKKTTASGREIVDFEEAVSLLAVTEHEGDDGKTYRSVHTIMEAPPGVLIGADWDEERALELLIEADAREDEEDRIQVTGPGASGIGHGLAVRRSKEPFDVVFFATRSMPVGGTE